MTQLTSAQVARILTPPVCRIMDILGQGGGEARVVGGAVRDIVMQRLLGDIDFATTLAPERVMELLQAQGIKTVPTGLAHGTITAVVERVGYEITTLRRDVVTDGRHAEVAFTDNWQEDAARRDFTINALYLDRQGRVYDYFDGAENARAGWVRFIGDARARILEDVLRILRYFRFHAWFGTGEPDAGAIAACCELASMLPKLSAERVAREVLKLLAARDPLPAWELMIDYDVMPHLLPQALDTERLSVLLRNEKHFRAEASPVLRLAALLPARAEGAKEVAAQLKLSRQDTTELVAFATLPPLLSGHLAARPLRRLLYTHGADQCCDALLLLDSHLDLAMDVVTSWDYPVFPIKGEDLVTLGVSAGPQLGKILAKIEDWWSEGDFEADREACMDQARRLI